MSSEPLIVRSIKRQDIDRPPVWIMRQAGRYLSEYLAIKEEHGFLKLCTTPELAAEVSLQPVRILDVDAAIIFSDILIPTIGMGIELSFDPGPVIANPIRNSDDINALRVPDAGVSCRYVCDAISLLRKELDSCYKASEKKGVIGFAGSPWTLACYLIEQYPYKHFQGTQVFAQQNNEAFHQLLKKLTSVIGDYVVAQIQSGAHIIQIFDSWGGILSAADYAELSLPYIQEICARITSAGALATLYVNGSSHLLNLIADSGAHCISVDWRTDLADAKKIIGPDITIQGNLDPTHLFGEKELVITRTLDMIGTMRMSTGYVVNLGHGILPRTPRENVIAFVNTAKESWEL